MRATAILAVFISLGLSACGGGGQGGAAGINADGGSPRAFTRNDGAVTSTFNPLNNNWTATQTVTISNDDAGATRGVVRLSADGASFSSSPSTSGYQVQVAFTATAPSDAGARAALAGMSVTHRDATDPGVIFLHTVVTTGGELPRGTSRSATATAMLPPGLEYQLAQDAGGGTISTTGLHGTQAEFVAGGGSISLSGTWDTATADAGGATVTLAGDIANLAASTGGGTVTATLACTRATQATLDTGGGVVDVTVSHAGNGVFDADAQTTGGAATVSIVGTSPVGTQTMTHQHYRSPNYDTGAPKISVAGRAGGGSVNIHD